MRTQKFKDFILASTADNSPDYLAGVKTTAGVTETVKSVVTSATGTPVNSGTASGADTYSVTIVGLATLFVGQKFSILFSNGNTGNSTLNPNSQGAIPLVKFGNSPLNNGDIKSGQVLDLTYDGTNLQIQSVTDNIVDAA